MALLNPEDCRRTASVSTVQTTEFLCLSSHEYDQVRVPQVSLSLSLFFFFSFLLSFLLSFFISSFLSFFPREQLFIAVSPTQVLKDCQTKEQTRKLDVMRQHPFFASWTEQELLDNLPSCQVQLHKRPMAVN